MSFETFLVFDIETAANDRAPEYYRAKRYDAPSNYKDPEKIEAAILEKRQRDMESAALSWWTGRVCCVSATPVNGGNALIGASFHNKDERLLLTDFFDYLTEVAGKTGNRITLIGKSSETFDIPFLIGRAIAYDLGLPDCLRPGGVLRDVDKIFGWSSQTTQRGRLADYAFGMAYTGKLGDGAGVAAMWLDIQMGLPGAWDRLVAYCEQDVKITAELLRRYLKFYIPRKVPEETQLEIPFG